MAAETTLKDTLKDGSQLYAIQVRSVSDAASQPLAGVGCPLCATSAPRPIYRAEGFEPSLVVCPGCGYGWLHPLPEPEEIAALYPPSYYGAEGEKFESLVELLVQRVGARHARFLSMGLPEGARILDVGCGRGVQLRALADQGFEAHGMELSEAATQGIDPRVKVRVAPDLAQVGYPEGWFDQVILWHVLEHMADPRATLAEVRRILRPGGRLVVAVPNFASLQARWAGADWFHLDLPRHLHHFPLPALRRLLEEEGLRCRSEYHFSLRQNPFGWVQSLLNRSKRLPRNGLYVLLQRRPADAPLPYDSATRLRLRLAWLFGMLPALGLSLVTTLLRSGATVHVVATRDAGRRGASRS